jgi:hypothetical protein
VLPVYCFDDRIEITKYGYPKTGSFRAQLLESLIDLDANLRKIGSDY